MRCPRVFGAKTTRIWQVGPNGVVAPVIIGAQSSSTTTKSGESVRIEVV